MPGRLILEELWSRWYPGPRRSPRRGDNNAIRSTTTRRWPDRSRGGWNLSEQQSRCNPRAGRIWARSRLCIGDIRLEISNVLPPNANMHILLDICPPRSELRKRLGARACVGTNATLKQAAALIVLLSLTGAKGGEAIH
eukprot:6772677-Pyramimonas_sp.AAC.1